MTARSLLAAAFGVLGVYWIAYFAYAILAAVIGRDPRLLEHVDRVGWASFVGPWLPFLAFGAVLCIARQRLARALVPEEAGPAKLPAGDVLRVLGVRLLGVYFVAAGAAGLLFVATGASTVQDGTRPVASVLVGTLLVLLAPQLDAWIRREQARGDPRRATP